MNPTIAAALAGLPSLERSGALRGSPLCKICGESSVFFDVLDFNKCGGSQTDFYRFGRSGVAVPYFQCQFCGFLFTDFFDDWTHDDFSRYIYNGDYAKVDPEYAGGRPQRLVETLAAQLKGCEELRILDYGSGNGLFAEGMRKAGFQSVDNFDPFSSPQPPTGRFGIITCFEVMEHAPFPSSIISDMATYLDVGGCIVFHTALQPPDIEYLRGNWWYVSPRNGHGSIYSREALAELGRKHGLLLSEWSGQFVFRPLTPSKRNKATSQAGTPLILVRLAAPREDGSCGENALADLQAWYGIEKSPQGPARWTQTREITWKIPETGVDSYRMRIVLPFLSEIRQGFAAECNFTIDGRSVTTFVESGKLKADIEMRGKADCIIKLRTPEPEQPRSPEGAKNLRRLGLRVRTRHRAAIQS
jgi:hypothetical protein